MTRPQRGRVRVQRDRDGRNRARPSLDGPVCTPHPAHGLPPGTSPPMSPPAVPGALRPRARSRAGGLLGSPPADLPTRRKPSIEITGQSGQGGQRAHGHRGCWKQTASLLRPRAPRAGQRWTPRPARCVLGPPSAGSLAWPPRMAAPGRNQPCPTVLPAAREQCPPGAEPEPWGLKRSESLQACPRVQRPVHDRERWPRPVPGCPAAVAQGLDLPSRSPEPTWRPSGL